MLQLTLFAIGAALTGLLLYLLCWCPSQGREVRMLILGRTTKPGDDTIVIETPAGEKIRVKLTKLTGNSARIGVEADASIRIYREEVRHPLSEVPNVAGASRS
jgi:sRNA-binding carbon storage regulator CsrA